MLLLRSISTYLFFARGQDAVVSPSHLAELHTSYEPREKRLLILCLNAEGFLAHSQVIVIKRYKNLYFAIFSDTNFYTYTNAPARPA